MCYHLGVSLSYLHQKVKLKTAFLKSLYPFCQAAARSGDIITVPVPS